MEKDTDVLNAREAAAILKAHAVTIRRYVRCGEIPAFKVGKNWRFHRDDLRRRSYGQDWKPSGIGS
jgi:excisionase family DNA binding protein